MTCRLLLAGPLRLQLRHPLSGPCTVRRAPIEIHLGCHLLVFPIIYPIHH